MMWVIWNLIWVHLEMVFDQDINTTPSPSPAPLGPITRARARQSTIM
jgi:hypothetical protein